MATMAVNLRVTQHCFIKASALFSRDGDIWFNNAVLGLKNNDAEFARNLLGSEGISPLLSPWLDFALVHEIKGNTTTAT